MIEQAVTFLHLLAERYGMLGLFAAEIIEEIIVPIPSAAVMTSGGFLFLGGMPFSFVAFQKLFFGVALPLALGLTIGSLFIYGLTYYFGRKVIDRYGRWLGVSWVDVEKAYAFFHKGHREIPLLILVRTIPLVPSVAVNAFCGLTRMKIQKYLPLTFFGALGRGLLMGFIGWQAGSVYFAYAEFIDRIEKIVLVLIALSVVGFIIYRRTKKPSPAPKVT
jgi:membrane protein DedA with SNARE-associated domain